MDFRGADGGVRPQALDVCDVSSSPTGTPGWKLTSLAASAITPRATSASHFSGSSFHGAECDLSPWFNPAEAMP